MKMNYEEANKAAHSPEWSRRAEAAAVLATRAGDDDEPMILRLLADEEDTAVTVAAAEALLDRIDAVGVRLLCIAYSEAGDETIDHINDTLRRVKTSPELKALFRGAAREGQTGAAEVLSWLHIDPFG